MKIRYADDSKNLVEEKITKKIYRMILPSLVGSAFMGEMASSWAVFFIAFVIFLTVPIIYKLVYNLMFCNIEILEERK